MRRILTAALAAGLLALSPPAVRAQSALPIVAAENFYGDIAAQLGGPAVQVTSILSNPDQDPHLFEASPSTARALQAARIAVLNGADYDPWMRKLLDATRTPDRQVIEVASLLNRKPGDNPHLWYDPAAMPAVARAIAAALAAADPARKAEYDARLQTVLDSLKPVDAKVAALRAKHAGTAVTATEPVFGYMAAALGLAMRNARFQLAVMNDTEPRASDVAAFEGDLRARRARVLIYNSQATGGTAKRLMRLAQSTRIPVVGVTETEPAGKTYQAWMLDQLDALDRALDAARALPPPAP